MSSGLNDLPRKQTSRRLTGVALLFLLALEGSFVAWAYLRVPSEAGSNFLFGFSITRLATLALTLAVTAVFALGAGLGLARPAVFERGLAWFAHRRASFLPWLIILGLAGLTTAFLPVVAEQQFGGYYLAVRPWLLWITLGSAETLLAVLLVAPAPERGASTPSAVMPKRLLAGIGVALGVFILVWLLMVLTKLGITPDDRYWNEASVPVLGYQVMLAWIAGLAAGSLVFIRKVGWKLDLGISLAIWLLAAFFWTQTPMPPGYFAPKATLPNNVVYPYSDALVHDQGAQYIFIGQGINNGEYHDKPVYMLMLYIFHLFAGQDYLRVVQIQSLFLAIFPVCLYWIGKVLHSRAAGLLVGLLAVMKETNAIAATMRIQVSHTRLMMSEFPTAVGIAILTLVLVIWLRGPRRSALLPLTAGGILGALILIRTNPLFLVPFVIAALLLAVAWRWKAFLRHSVFLVVGMMLVIGPWYFLNQTKDGKSFLTEKISAVFQSRYDVPSDAAPAANSADLPASTPAAPLASTQNSDPVSLFSRLQKAFSFAPGHFFHNLEMSALVLPISPLPDDFLYLESMAAHPWWKPAWNSSLDLPYALLLLVNLGVVAMGLGAAWHTTHLAGLMPAVMLVGYFFSNALGRTSGSRYLVPTDWVVYFYFGLGLIQLSMWAFALLRQRFEPVQSAAALPAQAGQEKPHVWQFVAIAVVLLGIGSALIWVGKLYPLRYAGLQTAQQVTQNIQNINPPIDLGVSQAQLAEFLTKDGAVMLRGRGLYPRYFYTNEGEPSGTRNAMNPLPYPRLTVLLLGPESRWVLLPMPDFPPVFPDAVDITVIGCQDGEDIQAQVMLVHTTPVMVYRRGPAREWSCPLAKPVCTQAGVCK